MRIIFVILGVISLLVMFMVIKHVEKPMLRVTVVGFLLIFVYVSYISFNRLGECQKNGTECSILNVKIPNVNSGSNDLNS